MRACLVTGATGVVGSALLRRLLEGDTARIYALTRASDTGAARARLAPLLAGVAPGARSAERVMPLIGDVEMPSFGMGGADLDAVLSDCTAVFHCAGVVRMNLPLADARRAAVGAAANLVALLQALRQRGRIVKCEYVSTVGVAGRDVARLPETWVDAPRTFHNTYEQAKAEAEAVIHAAVGDGLAITVHRPSMVVGDSRSGWIAQFQVFYHLVEFLLGPRTRGLFPAFGDARLDLVPSDVVAAALALANDAAATSGRVFNLCAGPDAVSLTRLQAVARAAARDAGVPLPAVRAIPRGVFRRAARVLRVFADARTRRALDTLPVFLDYLESSQAFENSATRATLQAAGVALPPIEAYLPQVLGYYFAARAAKRAGAAP